MKQVSDFFMYLYQDLNRCPSTIDGYRTAIVDTLGPVGLHISQSSDLNRLLSSFHRVRPKHSRNLPEWNLSVVLNKLTEGPEVLIGSNQKPKRVSIPSIYLL